MTPTPEQIALAKRVAYSSRDIAEAIAAAELRGHTRAVQETAIHSVHKAVAAEREAVVAFLRVGAALDPRSPLAGYADAIESGDHRKERA